MITGLNVSNHTIQEWQARGASWLADHPIGQKIAQNLVDTEAWGRALLNYEPFLLVRRKGEILRLHQNGWNFSEKLLLELAQKIIQGNFSPLEKRGVLRSLLDMDLSADALQEIFRVSQKGRWLVLHGAVADQERAELAGRLILHRNSDGRLWSMMAREAWQESPVGSASPPIRKVLLSFPPARQHPEVRSFIYDSGVPEHLLALLREPKKDWRKIFLKLVQKRPTLARVALEDWPERAQNCLQADDWPRLLAHPDPDIRQRVLRLVGRTPIREAERSQPHRV